MISKIPKISFREKWAEKRKNEALDKYGIVFANIDDNTNRLRDRLLVCLIRAVLIFFASFGTIGFIISAFGLNYKPLIVIPALLIVCTFIAFLYYNKITFYIGYFGFLWVFLGGSMGLYAYINSGFQAFANTAYEKYSDYFSLNTLREATELISNRTLTVSVAMIFLGAFLAILLNITISNSMSLVQTFLITFPITEIALYIDLQPDIIYPVMLFVAYISIGILNRSEHFRLSSLKHAGDTFVTKPRFSFKEPQVISHSYISSGEGMLRVLGTSICFVALFLIITSGIFFSNYDSRLITNKLKASADEYVKSYIQNGAWSFFDRYKSTGGLNQGRLGGVSRVTPDYQTDLKVTFVPYNSPAFYLKGFIGNKYTGNSFTPDTAIFNFHPNNAYSPSAAYSFSEYTHPTGILAKMQIENIDVGPIDVLPYDSLFYKYKDAIYSSHVAYKPELLEFTQDTAAEMLDDDLDYTEYENKILDVIYDPFVPNDYYYNSPYVDNEYRKFVYDNYLDVPYNLEETLDDICAEAGLYKIRLEGSDYEYTSKVLSQLKTFFVEEFSYTMAPGSTPPREDVIKYFLTKRRRGFCAHFASSATLILREMGIPTRYVEGYMIPLGTIIDNGEAVSANIDGWINKENNYSATQIVDGSGVVSVEITDGNAHAWVEVYIDHYGWIPFEFTPPSTEDMVTNFSLRNLFSGLMQVGNNENRANNNANDEASSDVSELNFKFDFFSTFNFILVPLAWILAFTIFTIAALILGKPIISKIRIVIYVRNGQYSKAARLLLLELTTIVSNHTNSEHWTIREYEAYLLKILKTPEITTSVEEDAIQSYTAYLNKALYSKNDLLSAEYEKCSSIHIRIKAALNSYYKYLKKARKTK